MPDFIEDRIQFTGIVVTYNEERHLEDCLKSLTFCQQLIVIDLGSDDSSVKIAKQCGAEIIYHERVPIVEEIREEVASYSRNEWIIFLDPDEIFPTDVEGQLRSMIRKNPDLALIRIPWQFYFKEKPLHTTFWGIEKAKEIVFNKRRIEFTHQVHKAIRPLDTYSDAVLLPESGQFIKHYWMVSYKELFKKHWRYLKREGRARFDKGERFSSFEWLCETVGSLKYSLLTCNGIRGGFTGIFLSFFYSWYISMSLLSLYRYEKRIAENEPR